MRSFFCIFSDLSDHDDSFCLRILEELCEYIYEIGSIERVSSDSDAGGLSELDCGGLMDGFVRQSATARNDADRTGTVDVTGHDADLKEIEREKEEQGNRKRAKEESAVR